MNPITIITIITTIATAGYMFMQDAQISRQKQQISTMQSEYSELASSHALLLENHARAKALHELDGQTILSLSTILQQNVVTHNENVQKQAKLEQVEPSVKDYLDGDTPDSLKRLLDQEDGLHPGL